MRISIVLSAAMLAILPVLARADVPPPPDDYAGPPSAHLAGLSFEHRRIRTTIDLGSGHLVPGEYKTVVLLTDCDAAAANCRLAKELGAIGGFVTTAGGKEVEGDVAVVQAAFAAAKRHRVRLIVTPDDEPTVSFGNPPPAKAASGPITLDVSSK